MVKYKYVHRIKWSGREFWVPNIKGVSQTACKTKREAALMADKALITQGKDPVNILKKKNSV